MTRTIRRGAAVALAVVAFTAVAFTVVTGAVVGCPLGCVATAHAATGPVQPAQPAPSPGVSVPRPQPSQPTAPVPPAVPSPGGSASPTVSVPLDLRGPAGTGGPSPLALVLLLGAVSILPALLIMLTGFTRIVIVLGFTRSALGANGIPPNQVLVGLALFITFFVMAPTLGDVNRDAVQPYLKGTITQAEAYDRGIEPFRAFMFEQVRERDLALFVKLSGKDQPATPADVPTTTLVPAFALSELRAAFLIGFVIFIPFLVIDLVVSAALSSMGMVMLPPVLIALPFKLLLFVAADGWYLVVQSLVKSFA